MKTTIKELTKHREDESPILNDFSPDYAVAPCETLQESLEFLRMKPQKLAKLTELSEQTIEGILNGSHEITKEIALKLHEVTGVCASLWLNMEKNYRKKQKLNENNKN